MTIGERIRMRMAALGLTQSALAREVGISQAAIWKLINSGQGSSHIHKIARALHTTPAFLSGETQNPDEGYVQPPSVAEVAREIDLVSVQEIDLALGIDALISPSPSFGTYRHFSKEWLNKYSPSDLGKLYFAEGVGDSMNPTIWENDLILIDVSQRDIGVGDKIWIVKFGGVGMIKRVRSFSDGSVRLISDNPNIPPENAKNDEVQILGRVIGVARRF